MKIALPSIPRSALLFSGKCFLAGMAALYIALSAGLENPSWAVVTSYIVAQPHAGATVSKGVFRMVGTLIGACAAVFMVPPLVQTPVLMCAAIALWLALCVFLQLIDRTARGYMFVLAGYTSCIIIFPILSHPQNIFEYATSRFVEISLGILCGTIVHSVVFPISTSGMVRKRLAKVLQDVQAVCQDALLLHDREKHAGMDRQKLAATVNELHELLLHQDFEGPVARAQTKAIRVTLAQIERILPLSLAVADRIDEAARMGPLAPALQDFLRDAREWFAATDATPQQLQRMEVLLRQCEALRPPVSATMGWHQALIYNLLERVADLIRLKGVILKSNDPAHLQELLQADLLRSRAIERDWRGAAGAGLAVAVTFSIAVALWIVSGWDQGYSAAMLAGVYFSVYSNTPDPAQMLKNKFVGVFFRLWLGGVYVVTILPAIGDFGAMVLSFAPSLLVSGIMMGMPKFSAMGFNLVIGVMSPSIVDRSFHTDFQTYLNAGIATLIGIYFAMLMVSVTRFLWLDGLVRRTFAAGRSDIAALRYLDVAELPSWRSRMVHRIGLLVLRMAATPSAVQASDALRDMMIGSNLAQLHAASQNAPAAQQAALQALVRQVATYYRTLPAAAPVAPPQALRAQVDASLADAVPAAVAGDASILLALTSLRRNLFPQDHSFPAAWPAGTSSMGAPA